MSPSSTTSGPVDVHPTALILGGLAAAIVASIVLAVSQGTDVGFFLASAVMTLALTLWLIGVIALGVRIGMHRD